MYLEEFYNPKQDMGDGLRRGCNIATRSLYASPRREPEGRTCASETCSQRFWMPLHPGPTIHKVRRFASSEHTLLLVLMNTCNDISSFHVQILKSTVTEKLPVEKSVYNLK